MKIAELDYIQLSHMETTYTIRNEEIPFTPKYKYLFLPIGKKRFSNDEYYVFYGLKFFRIIKEIKDEQ